MRNSRPNRVLAGCRPENFVGRRRELDRILHHARSSARGAGLTLAAPPGAGTSELLRQAFDRLFSTQEEIIPFYFAFRHGETDPRSTARRFLHEFVVQTVAFRRRDSGIITTSPGLGELAELAAPQDGYWIDRLVDSVGREETEDERLFVRNCLSAPARAAAAEARTFVMVDGLQHSLKLEGRFLEELEEIFHRVHIPFIFAGWRRFAFDNLERRGISLKPLDFRNAAALVETIAADYEVRLSDSARDLTAVQLKGNPALIDAFLRTAYPGERMESYQAIEQVYCDSIFGGSIGRRFDDMLRHCCPSREVENAVVSLLFITHVTPEAWLSIDAWKQRLGGDGLQGSLDLLNLHELIRVHSGRVEVTDENLALTDYISTRFQLEITGETRALAFGEALSRFISRAPELMQAHYRSAAAVGLRRVLAAFTGQDVPLALIDYGRFRDEYRGLEEGELIERLKDDPETVKLPQVFFVADTVSFYRPIEKFVERERSAAARGFEAGTATEIVWIAAEVDSKLEASRETVEFWSDRLEMAAVRCDFDNYRIWLVAPEGFTEEALGVLRERNSFGSSRRQFELLRRFIGKGAKAEARESHEFEMVLPMNCDTELIAAHTLEEIAKRQKFDTRSINQIKTALVEASINAAEHGLSPDRRLHHRFRVEDDRLVVTISNRGLRLSKEQAVVEETTEGRRGWGLTLMRSLMDEVKIENVDDGTQISMTKYLKAPS